MATETHNSEVELTQEELDILMAETREKGAAERTIRSFAVSEARGYMLTNDPQYKAKKVDSLYSSFSTNLKHLRDKEPEKFGDVLLKKVGDKVFLAKRPAKV